MDSGGEDNPMDEVLEGKGALGRIEAIIGPSIEAMGYELVRVHLTGGQRPTLQIMAERQDGAAMTVDDCADISRAVSALLDVEDPLPGAYTLEVSSPGIDRPLTRLKDFVAYAGYEARIEAKIPIGGRRRWVGRLQGVDGDIVRIAVEKSQDVAAIPFAEIHRAKLVLNDELLKAAAQAQAGDAPGTEGGMMDVSEDDRPAKRPRRGPGRFAKKGGKASGAAHD